jgi:hypothetical protein
MEASLSSRERNRHDRLFFSKGFSLEFPGCPRFTLSEGLFKQVSDLGRVAPYQFHWKTVMDIGVVSKGLILVDTGQWRSILPEK